MKQGGGDGGGVQTQGGADAGRTQGVVDVVLTAGPALIGVLGQGDPERVTYQFAVEVGVVADDLPEEAVDHLLIIVGKSWGRHAFRGIERLSHMLRHIRLASW